MERKTIHQINARARIDTNGKGATNSDIELMNNILIRALAEIEEKTQNRILFNTRTGFDLD